MATRKKPPIKAPRTEAAFVVVLEDLNSKFNVFGEGLQAVRDELHGFRADVDRRFGQVEVAILEHSREIRQLRGGLDDVRGEIGELRGEVGELRGELGTVRGEVGELRGEVGELRGELGTVRGEVGELRGEVGELRGELGTVRGEVGELRGELGAVRGELGQVRSTVTRIETALTTKVDREQVESIVERALGRR